MDLVFKQFEPKTFPSNAQADGQYNLTSLEIKDYIDFEVKRIYFVTDAKGATTSHFHKIEKELFVMLQGSCTALIDHGTGLQEIPLVGKKSAIYVGNYVWHGFKDFAPNSVLLALTSTNYNPDRSDYVLDYEEFKRATA